MELIKPAALPRNATLGIICPSTPLNMLPELTIENGYKRLREKGFTIKEASNCRVVQGHSAGTIQERVDAIHSFLKDPDVDAIMAFWGGFQSHQLLEYLDYELIMQNPKPIIGYSDITALHIGIHKKTGLVTFLGPGVISFSKPEQFDYTWNSFEQVMINPKPVSFMEAEYFSDNKWYEHPDKKMIIEKTEGWKTYRGGEATGHMIAGNLGTMLLLAGTPYWPNMNGAILAIEEDEEETPKTIDRMFTQLRQMGVFDQISGLVVGRFVREVGFTEKDSLEMIFDNALKDYSFPVLYNVDFGHSDPLLTIPNGIQSKMDANNREISYLETAVQKNK